MKKIICISGFIALLSFCLMVASAIHISFLKENANDTVKFINEKLINHSSLTKLQSKKLTRSLRKLAGGQEYLARAHKNLWKLSVIGFAVITFLSGFVTIQLHKANPLFK